MPSRDMAKMSPSLMIEILGQRLHFEGCEIIRIMRDENDSDHGEKNRYQNEVSESRLSELVMARGVRLAMDQRDPSSYLMPRVLSLRAYASYSDVNK